MKRKTIEGILRRKFNSWLLTLPPSIKGVVKEGTIITGGSIVSMLLNEEVSDYDLYFRNKETALLVAKHYVKKFREANPSYTFKNGRKVDAITVVEDENRIKIMVRSVGVAGKVNQPEANYAYFETLEPGSPEQEGFIEEALKAKKRETTAEINWKKEKYVLVFLTSNAITLSGKMQLVLRFYGEPDEIHKNYDFVHVTNYWTSWEGKLVLRSDALEAILTKELRYQGSLFPICSLFRVRKFIERGWTINAGQLLKMALQINELNLRDMTVLEEQLIGVDVAYMQDLINRLRQVKSEDIDNIYICRLIDEIF